MIYFPFVTSDEDVRQILRLQSENLAKNITAETLQQQGFVTVEHDFPTLRHMNDVEPSTLIKDDGRVVGYALAMSRTLAAAIPILIPMFEVFKQVPYKTGFLSDQNYIVVGQVCVADGYRGQGLFDKMYAAYRDRLQHQYEVAVTEISHRNQRSIAAHRRVGFETIYSYQDPHGENWDIVAWDWNP
jgi:hypothetical protein